jgi:hypothetical protein
MKLKVLGCHFEPYSELLNDEGQQRYKNEVCTDIRPNCKIVFLNRKILCEQIRKYIQGVDFFLICREMSYQKSGGNNAAIIVSVLALAVAVVAIIVVIVLNTKKTAASTQAYTLPDSDHLYILENEGIAGGFSAVYLGSADPTLFDAQWCTQAAQLLTFEYVQDGATSDTKIYRIRQTSASSTPYLAYDSTQTDDLISQVNVSASNALLWQVTSLPSIQSGHIESTNGTTLGVYSIRNVQSGMGLSYSVINGTNKVSMAVFDSTSKSQQWTITQVGCV